jgi:hypothetical protein
MFSTALAAAAAAAASGASSIFGQERANRENRDIWRKSQAWQEMMSNTAWQRTVADMKKAGINPMLAVSQGGASTPTSAIGAPMQDSLGRGVSSAIAAASLNAQLQKNQADIAESKSRTAFNVAQTIATTAKTAKERATQPVYGLLGDIFQSSVNSARSFDEKNPRGNRIDLSKSIFNRRGSSAKSFRDNDFRSNRYNLSKFIFNK